MTHSIIRSTWSIETGDQKSQLESLLFIEARITVAGIVEREVVVIETLTTTSALGNSFSGQLKVNATKIATFLSVNSQGVPQLRQDIRELTGFDASGGASSVTMHGIALPDYTLCELAIFNGSDMGWKQITDRTGAKASDERNLANFAGRVEYAE